jgi:hypothetical protein
MAGICCVNLSFNLSSSSSATTVATLGVGAASGTVLAGDYAISTGNVGGARFAISTSGSVVVRTVSSVAAGTYFNLCSVFKTYY